MMQKMFKIKNISKSYKFSYRLFCSETGTPPNDLYCIRQEIDYSQAKNWNLYYSLPPTTKFASTYIFLFPGQGCQIVGMCKSFINIPKAKRLFDSASSLLKYDLLKLCIEGPSVKLNQTMFCQPAIYVASMAALEKMKLEQPELIENCIAAAGYSLGEITSLVFAGSISFEGGLHFIRVRAQQMQLACNNTKGGLLIVRITPESRLNEALEAAKQYCQEKLQMIDPVCQIATHLFKECKVIGGQTEALDFVEAFAKEFKLGLTKRLNVSGAFHTRLMHEAVNPCRNALERIDGINQQKINVFSNATGTIHTSQSEIKRLLVKQICHSVHWEQILVRLYMRPSIIEHPFTVEIGPTPQLKDTISKTNPNAFKKYQHIST